MCKLQRTRTQSTQFATDISDTPVALKQSQDHQTYNDSGCYVNPKKVIIMQSLKDLALSCQRKKANFNFFPNEKICQLSPLNICKTQKYWYIHDLLDVINSSTKFRHDRIRT